MTRVDVFREAINSCVNNTFVSIFYPSKFVTAKRWGDLTSKSSWNRKHLLCLTVAIEVGFVKQDLSCNYIFFSSLLQGKHPWLHGNHLFSQIIFLIFFPNAVCIQLKSSSLSVKSYSLVVHLKSRRFFSFNWKHIWWVVFSPIIENWMDTSLRQYNTIVEKREI